MFHMHCRKGDIEKSPLASGIWHFFSMPVPCQEYYGNEAAFRLCVHMENSYCHVDTACEAIVDNYVLDSVGPNEMFKGWEMNSMRSRSSQETCSEDSLATPKRGGGSARPRATITVLLRSYQVGDVQSARGIGVRDARELWHTGRLDPSHSRHCRGHPPPAPDNGAPVLIHKFKRHCVTSNLILQELGRLRATLSPKQ